MYGTVATSPGGSNNTQDTELSTITTEVTRQTLEAFEKKIRNNAESIKETSKMETREMRNSILDEMKKLNDQASARVSKIEEKTKGYEAMLMELHNNNKMKAAEMLQYEKRLQQITNNTTQTVCKVDRIGEALKRFIEVKMDSDTDVNKKNLQNIVEYLDEEDETNEDGKATKKKHKPSPDGESVLGGEGSRE